MTIASKITRLMRRNWLSKLVRGKSMEHKEEQSRWAQRNYAAPSPSYVKERVLLRLGAPDAVWVETGTFKGDTTAFLALNAKKVYTIEPDDALFKQASARFRGNPRVDVIHGLSEQVLPTLLPTLGGTLNFWLDGHYSGGITHKGPTNCPVREELASIEQNLSRFDHVTVLIDDVRCFDPSISTCADYPNVDYLVDWARANHLRWHIEHDIFVAKTRTTPGKSASDS